MISYEKLITRKERENLERSLGMGSGFVLDFSDRTFNDFFYETVRIDPQNDVSLFDRRGTSKANRLRSFIEGAEPRLVAKLLRELWSYKNSMPLDASTFHVPDGKDLYFGIVNRLEGTIHSIDSSAIEAFEPSETLEELISAIKRDLEVTKPHAALDRLHTYCMKRFASLVKRHHGNECSEDEALHARVGKYVKLLISKKDMTQMSERIIKSSISVFESMNDIRNNRSLAHDNPTLVGADEARFIFDSVTAILRFLKSIDSDKFED